MLFVVLCPGTSECSTGSGSGFKASQKMGKRLKFSPDRLGEAWKRICDSWFTRHRFIPYTTATYHGVYKVSSSTVQTFCCFSMGRNQYWAGRVYDFVCLLYNGNSRRLNRKWFYREAGIRTCDPWFTRYNAYPLHHGGFSAPYKH